MSYSTEVLHLTEADVRASLPMKAAIECLRAAFRALAEGTARNQPRRRLILDTGAVLHSLAGSHSGYFGTKVYSTHPKHGAHFTVLLYSAATGVPVAQMEANYLGQIRTGAASGLAVDVLRGPGAVTLGLIGSGFQAAAQLEAVRAVRPVTAARVWSRDSGKRERFAVENSCLAASSAEEAVAGCDVVITATSAREPVIEASWIRPDALVCGMGSNWAKRRELPAALVLRPQRIFADSVEQCRMEAGDLVMALDEAGWARVEEFSSAVASPPTPGPALFKSVGLGLEDVAVAAYLYEKRKPSGPDGLS